MSEQESAPKEPVHVESADAFEAYVSDGGVYMVDFYADWCGPCKMLEPAVEELAAETAATVLKVDIDELQDLARDQGIRSVPTLQFYAGGEKVEQVIGVQDKDDLKAVIDSLLSG
jgi:thioredoxin 1